MPRCIECGFLALQKRQTGQRVELCKDTRRTDELMGHWAQYDRYAIRFREQRGFETDAPTKGDSYINLDAARQDVPCDHFVEYSQGFSPQEHAEMLSQQIMMQRADEIRREEMLLEQLKMQRADETRKEQRTFDRLKLAVTVILGLLAAFIALVAAGKFPWLW